MYTFPNSYKKHNYKFTREYNIISIISFSIAILGFISLFFGSIILFSYLKILNKTSLFVELLNDKLLYAISFASLFLITAIILYSSLSSLIILLNKRKKTEINQLIFLDIIITNIAMLIFILWINLIYEVNGISDWNRYSYISNFIFGISLFLLFPLYIIWSYKEQKWAEIYLKKTTPDLITKTISLFSSILGPGIVYIWGTKSSVFDDAMYYILIFWLFPLIALLLLNILLLNWKRMEKNGKSGKITILFIATVIWFTIIINMSPLLMSAIGINEIDNKEWCIDNRIIKGRILLKHGNYIIFMEQNKSYRDSIVYDKKDINPECKESK